MSYQALWFGCMTSSAFFYGVGLGLLMSPPITWGIGPHAAQTAADAKDVPRRNALVG